MYCNFQMLYFVSKAAIWKVQKLVPFENNPLYCNQGRLVFKGALILVVIKLLSFILSIVPDTSTNFGIEANTLLDKKKNPAIWQSCWVQPYYKVVTRSLHCQFHASYALVTRFFVKIVGTLKKNNNVFIYTVGVKPVPLSVPFHSLNITSRTTCFAYMYVLFEI